MNQKLRKFMPKTRKKISANGVRKRNLIQRENYFIFLIPLTDICSCFKQNFT